MHADLHRAIARTLDSPPGFDAFNLGTGRGVSVLELKAAAEAVTGRPIATRLGPRRAGDPAILVADPRRAHVALDWTPRWPAVEDQIRSAWRWHRRERPA